MDAMMPKRQRVEVDSSSDAEERPKRHRLESTSKATRSGIINSIAIKNFMCHDNFAINNFSDSVNFIVGRNGSGKSAIITALVVGLGGKANATNRGNSVKSLVKTGKQQAKVEISLANCGPNAYCPDTYGEEIIVERIISCKGGGSYKLMNSDRQLVSKKRDELEKILFKFRVLVENPLVVLNQDASRNFLHSSHPADRYRLFYKASLLESIEEHYEKAEEWIRKSRKTQDEKTEFFQELAKKLDVATTKWEAVSSIDNLKATEFELKRKLAWSHVHSRAQETNPWRKQIEKDEIALEKLEKREKSSKKVIADALAKRNNIMKEMEDHSRQMTSCRQERDLQRNKVMEKRREAKQVERELREAEKLENEAKLEYRAFRGQKEKIMQESERNVEGEKKARMDKIAELEEQKEKLNSELKIRQNDNEQFRNAVEKCRELVAQRRMDENAVKSEITTLHNRMKDLKSSGSNSIQRYGSNIRDLVIEIDRLNNLGKFTRKPLGPLGSYISLPDMKYALAIENCLGGLLRAFVCNSHQDEVLVHRLMKKHNVKTMVITGKFLSQVHDVSRNKPSSPYPTVYDVIECKEPVVMNCFIDQSRIESVILIETNEEARNYMKRPNRGVLVGYSCQSGDQLYPSPNYKYYANRNENVHFLVKDVSTLIQQTEQDINRFTRKYEQIRRERIMKDEELKKQQSELEKARKQQDETQKYLRRCQNSLNELNMTEEQDIPNIDEIEAALTEAAKALEHSAREKSRKQEIFDELVRQEERLSKVLLAMEEKLKSDGVHSKQRILQELSETYENNEDQVKKIQGLLKEKKKDIDNCKKQIKNIENEVDQMRRQTLEVFEGEEIETRRKPSDIEEEIKKTAKKIDLIEKEHGNRNMVEKEYFRLKKKYEKIKTELSELDLTLKSLSNGVEIGKIAINNGQLRASTVCKNAFLEMSHKRFKDPNITIDHSNKTIEIFVDGKPVRSMSGGERSFTTVCFAIGLWEIVQSPFRCLDEFDVFMDMINRKTSLQLLLDAYKRKPCQYIFLTPLAVQEILPNGFQPKVYEMKAPERGHDDDDKENREN
ncbi:DgyrCDS13393 [Dimorphilus gyrociliatus]|uniref:DgyrCDS13393 n=1 Tax=Dimorphilus gyrociliatus TaxID=2664684 RepID=A0A7I8WAJ9_9ANNE|nr:DgyrCDS13393 [Dimorphilus gyrociliatus]